MASENERHLRRNLDAKSIKFLAQRWIRHRENAIAVGQRLHRGARGEPTVRPDFQLRLEAVNASGMEGRETRAQHIPGAILDPKSPGRYYRSVIGDLALTAGSWRTAGG